MKKILYTLSILLFISAIFTSCGNPSQPEKNEVTVTYYSEYDSQNLPEPLTVEKGYKIKTEDIQPLSDSDNDFVKWETKTGIGIIVGYVVDEDQTFYAKWTPKASNKDPEKGTGSDDGNGKNDDSGDGDNGNGNGGNGTGTGGNGDNGGKQNPPSKNPDTNKVTYSDGSTVETVRVPTADGGYEETVTTKTKNGIITSVKTTKYTKNADGTETIETEVPNGTKRRTYTSSKDKNGVWTASSDILKAEPDTTGKGIKFTVTKYNNVNWATDYPPQLIEKNTGLTVLMPSDTEAVTAQEYVLYFPYVQSGKTYEFTFSGSNSNGYEYSDLIHVTAGEGIGETNNDFDIEKWNTIKPCCKYNAVDKHFWCGFEHSFTSLLDLVKNNEIKSSCHIDFGIFFGTTDWHPGDWKTGNVIRITGSYAITFLNAPIVKCDWNTFTLDDLAEYDNKYFTQVTFYYSTIFGNFCKRINSEQFTYKPVSLPNFYVGKWETGYYDSKDNFVELNLEINNDEKFELSYYNPDETIEAYRGNLYAIDEALLDVSITETKYRSDTEFQPENINGIASIEIIDNNHFIISINDSTISFYEMLEREGSAFNVNVASIAGNYKIGDEIVTFKTDGSFEGEIDGTSCKGTIEFNKNKITATIEEPLKYQGIKYYGIYTESGVVVVENYKFVKQSN